MIWRDNDRQRYVPAIGKRGRQRVFSDDAIQFCLSIKRRFGLALRQSLGLVEGLLRLAGLDCRMADFSTPEDAAGATSLPSRWTC